VAVPVTSHLRHQAFKAASSNERPLASSFGGYRRILTSGLTLWIARKIQRMGTTYFQFGCRVGKLVSFLPFSSPIGNMCVLFLFLFNSVLLRNRILLQLPHWLYNTGGCRGRSHDAKVLRPHTHSHFALEVTVGYATLTTL
jgi:hypothetical protein